MENQNMTVDVFVPIVAELNALKLKAQHTDRGDLAAVKAVRLELKAKRVEVEKFCKGARENANNFAKMVIAKEKELVAIISPEEEELASIEAEIKRLAEREERRALLPNRIERLTAIWGTGHHYGITEDDLLDMDGSTFEGLVNRMLAEKNQADRDEIARQKAEIDRQREEQDKEAKRLEDEKKAQEREEQARQDERDREEQRKEDARIANITNRKRELVAMGLMPNPDTQCYENEFVKVSHEEVEMLEDGAWAVKMEGIRADIARLAREREEAIREQERLADEKYQEWLTSLGYDPETCILREEHGVVELYRFAASYTR